MNILFLKGFNNYFNRIVKRYSTLTDYQSNSSSYLNYSNINFNPNDGIATDLVVGNPNQQVWTFNGGTQATGTPLNWENDGAPDYAVCYEMEGTPAAAVIKHRWFIMEAQRTRNGQYRLAFKRDVLADHFNEIMTAPCFVEKGNINNVGDSFLFNSENMTVNQIKQSEVLLKDNTGCGWIVGYVSQDKTRYPASNYYESTSPVATIEAWADVPQAVKDLITLGHYQRPVPRAGSSWGIPAGRCYIGGVNWKFQNSPAKYQLLQWNNVTWAGQVTVGIPAVLDNPVSGNIVITGLGFQASGNCAPDAAATFAEAIRFNNTLRTYYINNKLTNGVDFDQPVQDQINYWNGRFVEKDGKVYQIKYEETQGRHTGPWWAVASNTTYYTAFTTEWNSFKAAHATDKFFIDGQNSILTSNVSITTNDKVNLSWEIYDASLTLEETAADSGYLLKTYIPANRIQACDTPMDLFAIPFSDNFKIYTATDDETGEPTTFFTMSKQVALQAAVSMAQAGNNVYDIQVLPYFPDPTLVSSNTSGDFDYDGLIYQNSIVIPYSSMTADKHYNYFYNTNDTPVGIVFWSRTSVFSVDINEQVSLDSATSLNLKLSNTCDLYRLTSPNYAGSFEFSLAKSGGRIEKFNADCTYKPFTPYIHVTPYLAGLYGENFSNIDDARGLLCGGDFSIARYTDAWANYELNNKNYQAMFDRQIQNLDVNQKIEMEKQDFANMGNVLNMVAAPFSVSGLAAIVKTGITNPLMTDLGAINETRWLQQQQQETKNYTIDMYNYNLGNIQALPNSLAKTTALTNNNKIFPFVEYFTCTDAERDAVKDKIKYNGMTVMKIGNLNNYAVSSDFDKVYVKGQLIRLENVNDDFHVIDAIYQEVNKGFFIPQ